MSFDVFGKSFLIIILALRQLSVELIAANLINGYFVHLRQIFTHFIVNPIVESNQTDIHVIDCFKFSNT